MQRRDDFYFAIWLPRQHGTRPAPARTTRRPGTFQFHAYIEPTADRRCAVTQGSARNPFPRSRIVWLRQRLRRRLRAPANARNIIMKSMIKGGGHDQN